MIRDNLTRYLFAVALAAAALCPVAAGQDLSEEVIERVREALPDEPTVPPEESRQVLVFNLCRGFVHGAIPLGAKTFELMGEETGAFETTQSKDIALFEPENLEQFDAIIMNNTTGSLFRPPNFDELSSAEQEKVLAREARLKKSLLDFVRGGKGIVGVHAATDCWYDWPEYGRLMGGYFWGHPWNEEVRVKLDEPKHPLNAAFGGEDFTVADEIYQFRAPYSRESLRVLLSLDTSMTDMQKEGINREDDDFAVSWIREYGQGRVFYCSLGHRNEVFWNPAVLRHYLDGIQYALGDLEADATPSALLPEGYAQEQRKRAKEKRLSKAFEQLRDYQYGEDEEAFRRVLALVHDTHGDAHARTKLEDGLLSLLEAETSLPAKIFACKQLYIVGTKRSVPALARLLNRPETADAARYALERMPCPEAANALVVALTTAHGETLAGVLNSLAQRKERDAAAAIAPFAHSDNETVAIAAIDALGAMGGEQAAIALERVLAGPPTARRAAAARAYAACADQMAQRGALAPRKRADAMYRQLLEEFDPDAAVRQAAYRGRVALASANAGSLIVEALRSDREELHEVALQAAHELPSDRLSVELAAMLPELSPSAKAGLVALLAERGGEAARAAIVKAADADDPALRVAALHALGQAGNAETVDLLVWKAAEAYKDEAEAARDSLARLRGEDVDHALLNQLEEGVWNECIQVIAAVEARRNRTAVPRLVEAAEEHDHPEVRSAAYSAVGALAGPEAFASVVQALTAEPDAEVRGEAVRAATRVAQGMPQDNRAAETVIDAMENASVEATASLVVLAGNLADPAALPKLYELAGSDSPKVRVAAIRALSDWPAPEPVERLLELASASEGQARALAMNGVLRLLALPSGRSADETLSLFERALAMAKTPAEKRRALQGLGQTRDPRAIEAIRPYLNNADLAEAAKEAMEALENAEVIATASHNPEAAHLALDGNPDTRWATGTAQEPGMWFQLDLGAGKTVTKLVLDASGSPGDYPRGYEVYASNDPTDFGEPIATGQGESAVVEIVLPETSQRLLRIVQTGSSGGLWWSIHEVRFD